MCLVIWEVTPNGSHSFRITLPVVPPGWPDVCPGCTRKGKMGSLSGQIQASGLRAATAPPVPVPDDNREHGR